MKSSRRHGFTIVELIIVIVVIGILATISIIAFNGIKQRAIVAGLQSDLSGASKQLAIAQATESNYPSDTSGLKSGSGTTYQYSVDNTANPRTFCLSASNGTTSYYVNNIGGPYAGLCAGQAAAGSIAWQALTTPVSAYWDQILMNSDGTKLVISVMSPPSIYRSSDRGASWTTATRPDSARDVRANGFLSPDGTKLFISTYGNSATVVYRSADFGTTWAAPGMYTVTKFASSTDGLKFYAVESFDIDNGGGSIYRSTNGGATVTGRASTVSWSAIATSGDGTRVVAVSIDTLFPLLSTDSGVTWTNMTSAGQRSWGDIVMSADGTKMAAIASNKLYTSMNSGATWAEQVVPGARSQVAMSADGMKIIATVYGNNQFVYTSKDAGSTWAQDVSLGAGYWRNPVVSTDGTRAGVIRSAASSVIYVGAY